MSNEQALLRDLISNLRRGDNERLLEAMAREINNHIFIRGAFSNGSGELNAQDMQIILSRYHIVETTLQLSERGREHTDFAPKHPRSNPQIPTARVTPMPNHGVSVSPLVNQAALDG